MRVLVACEESQAATSFGNGKKRSKTFPGIARAMALQWAGDITDLSL